MESVGEWNEEGMEKMREGGESTLGRLYVATKCGKKSETVPSHAPLSLAFKTRLSNPLSSVSLSRPSLCTFHSPIQPCFCNRLGLTAARFFRTNAIKRARLRGQITTLRGHLRQSRAYGQFLCH